MEVLEMPGDVDIASAAALFADPTRASILLALSDERAFTASELARMARVAPSTASAHLARLVESRLLVMEKQGRNHFYRLADPAVVTILEQLAVFAPAARVRSLREAAVGEAVRRARTCYNHLAGSLGVALTQTLVERGTLLVVDGGYTISNQGELWCEQFGINVKSLKKGHHPLFMPHHIDWSERRHHLAGSLGAALAHRLFELEWIKRLPSSRAVCVTERGREALKNEISLCFER